MDELVAWLRKYLKAEFEAEVTALTENDQAKVQKKIKAVNAFWAAGSRSRVLPPDGDVGDEERARAKETIERVLFLVKQLGKMYQAIVGEDSERHYGHSYVYALFIAQRKGEPRIVAQYAVCPICWTGGQVEGKKCPGCKGTGMAVKVTGKTIDFGALGSVTAVRKLRAPDSKRSLVNYDSY